MNNGYPKSTDKVALVVLQQIVDGEREHYL